MDEMPAIKTIPLYESTDRRGCTLEIEGNEERIELLSYRYMKGLDLWTGKRLPKAIVRENQKIRAAAENNRRVVAENLKSEQYIQKQRKKAV
jgi:hypothetical protein